jgi:hypothetical protein
MPAVTRNVTPKSQFEDTQTSNPKDYKIPLALLGVGVLIYMVYALIVGGIPGVAAMALVLPLRIVIQAALGIVACMITAKIMGTAFGYAGPAAAKLAAVFVFPGAVTFLIPYIGWIIALLLYWGLLEWLFELEALETIMLVIVIFFVNIGAILLLAFLGLALVH